MADTETSHEKKVRPAAIRKELAHRIDLLLRCELFSDHFRTNTLADPHTKKYVTFGKDFCKPNESKVALTHAIILLFANRSGSNFLADLIASTGYYNTGGEMFNWPVVQKQCEKAGITSFGGYLDRLKGRAIDGRLCVKASLAQYMFLHASTLLDSHFPQRTVVIIERADKLAQAISLWIALHTKQWTSSQTTEWKGDVPFSPVRLSKLIEREFDQEKDTRLAMSLLNETFVTARYEEFQREPEHTVKRVLRDCGIAGRIEIDKDALKVKKQSNELNATLRRQFIAQFSPSA